MPYKQFEIKLAGNETSGFYAEVLGSPGFRRTDHISLDLPFNEIRAWREALQVGGSSAEATHRLGRLLFEAVFRGDILRLWESSVGAIGFGNGLRLRLDIRSSALAVIPWEIMHDGYAFLAQTITTPIVRCLFNHRSSPRLENRSAPNILVVTSTPSNAPQLPNVEAEVSSIMDNLSRLKRLTSCELLPHATRQSLLAKLRDSNYDILHYIGHGVFDGQSGYLELEDGTGRSDRVDSVTLGQFLTDTSVRLLFLNSCETAFPSPAETSRGTAEASLLIGIPTVIAMSAVVMDRVAAEFANTFYEVLVERHSIEFCMTEARKAITNYSAPYWAIPVLFTNTTDDLPAKKPKHVPQIVIDQRGENNTVARKIIYRR